MARIALHYLPGNSLLHRWDARCKFFGLLMITATLIQTKISWFIFDSILLVALFFLSRFPFKQLLRELRFWIIFLFILFLFQSLFTPGLRPHSFPWLPVSKEGLLLGGLTCWRLGLILGYAVLFTAVTRPRELRDALIWLLKPIPFLPERRIGLMVSLTLRFFSRTLDQVEEVRLAHQARLGDQNKNPIRKAKFLVLPILRRSILEAEEVTFALAARGYRDDLSIHFSKIPMGHLMPLFLLGGVLLTIWWIQYR
ncbi:MAG: energy-coupling factor transporter transmembrane protein EcfT [Deltaproteobacteria bacterium]|nr:energy-coupling factor transporter transmembrane protein EcfT [Deltaproteobacteria bacterium]